MERGPGVVIGVAGGLVGTPPAWLALALGAAAATGGVQSCVADAGGRSEMAKLAGRWRPCVEDLPSLGAGGAVLAGPMGTSLLVGPARPDPGGRLLALWEVALAALADSFGRTFVALPADEAHAARLASCCDALVLAVGHTGELGRLQHVMSAAPQAVAGTLLPSSPGGGDLDESVRAVLSGSHPLGCWPEGPSGAATRGQWSFEDVLAEGAGAAGPVLAALEDLLGARGAKA